MALTIYPTPGVLRRFRHPTGAYQRTFRTPLDQLPLFVAALLAGTPPISTGSVTLKGVVFDPEHLTRFLSGRGLDSTVGPDVTITASGAGDLNPLLLAALEDCIDFYFLPKPNRFLVYADHDEFITVFSSRPSAVSRIAHAMALAGVGDLPEPPGHTRT